MPSGSKRSAPEAEPGPESSLPVVKRSRPRTAGSRNLKKHESQVIQQHLLDRTRKQKDIEFVFDGVVQDYETKYDSKDRQGTRGS